MISHKRFRFVVIVPLCLMVAAALLFRASITFAAPSKAPLNQTVPPTPTSQAEEESTNPAPDESEPDDASQDDVSQDDASQDDAAQDDASQDDASQENAAQDDAAQDDAAQDDAAQDDASADDAAQNETVESEAAQEPPATQEPQTYIVQTGDTLLGIAARFNTTVAALVSANNLANPNFIFVGQRLRIPTGDEETTSTEETPTVDVTPPVTPTTPVTETVVPTETGTVTDTGTLTATVEATSTIVSPWAAPDLNIETISPVGNTRYHSPIEVIGYSQTFEGIVNIRLLDGDGNVLAERAALGGAVDGHDFFHTYIRFVVTEEISATLELFEFDTTGNAPAPDVVIPLTLLPGQRVLDLSAPDTGDIYCGEVAVSGYSFTFEGNVPITLAERDGETITTIPATGGGVSYRDFGLNIEDVIVDEPRPLLVSAYEESANDGVQIDTTRVPISVYPIGHPACP